MLKSIFQLFARKPWYRNLVTGMFLSAIGSGLTQTAIYSELAAIHAGTYSFGMALAASLLPGIFSSSAGARLTKVVGPFVVLIIAELGGAASLIVPAVGYNWHVIQLLGISTFLPGLFGGLCVGAGSQMIKSNFTDSEYSAVAALGAVLFTGTVIVANGLGTVLITFMPFNDFLLFDALTYCVGGLALWTARKNAVEFGRQDPARPRKVKKRFTHRQRKAFLAMPLLAAVTCPGIALLPAYGSQIGMASMGTLSISCTAALLFAKSLGQIIGPFVVRLEKLSFIFDSLPKILGLVAAFFSCYAAAFSIANVWVGFAFVVFAHIATNILVVAVESAFYFSIPKDDFASVMVSRYQLQVVMMTVLSIGVTILATRLSIIDSYLLFTIPASCVFAFVTARNSR